MSSLSFEALQAVAVRNGSVNVHLASAWDLRWHDPFWLSAWERWSKARSAWDRDWWFVPIKELGDLYSPDPARITIPRLAASALEYIEARKAYLVANGFYPQD
jgi:hypothetical protein